LIEQNYGKQKKEPYRVGDIIYDAAIYDGLNTFLTDLQFYKSGLKK
jgi:hypothetical protein